MVIDVLTIARFGSAAGQGESKGTPRPDDDLKNQRKGEPTHGWRLEEADPAGGLKVGR